MAMMLRPARGGAWLGVDEVIQRLQSEFFRVKVLPGTTAEYALGVAANIRKGGHADLANRIEAVKDRGVWIGVIEGIPELSLVFPVLPECPIMAGFQSEAHLDAMQPLLKRCAAALGYELS